MIILYNKYLYSFWNIILNFSDYEHSFGASLAKVGQLGARTTV